jgi:hypothetical protein
MKIPVLHVFAVNSGTVLAVACVTAIVAMLVSCSTRSDGPTMHPEDAKAEAIATLREAMSLYDDGWPAIPAPAINECSIDGVAGVQFTYLARIAQPRDPGMFANIMNEHWRAAGWEVIPLRSESGTEAGTTYDATIRKRGAPWLAYSASAVLLGFTSTRNAPKGSPRISVAGDENGRRRMPRQRVSRRHRHHGSDGPTPALSPGVLALGCGLALLATMLTGCSDQGRRPMPGPADAKVEALAALQTSMSLHPEKWPDAPGPAVNECSRAGIDGVQFTYMVKISAPRDRDGFQRAMSEYWSEEGYDVRVHSAEGNAGTGTEYNATLRKANAPWLSFSATSIGLLLYVDSQCAEGVPDDFRSSVR